MHPLTNIATAAARKAGQIIEQSSERLSSIKITEKRYNDFVTEVDKAAEQAIISHIRKAYPQHKIMAEESAPEPLQNQNEEFLWIIDPLDGTRNYMQGFPHYSVSIALQVNGRIEHGVIYDPVRKEMFTASRGQGAFMNNHRIRVSVRNKMDHALLGTGFPFHNKELITDYMRTFESLFKQCGSIRRAGSAALDLAYVASGRLDGFWEFQLKPWDMAAGILLIKEAGGMVTDFKGGENYLKSGNIVASNTKLTKIITKSVHDALIGL